MAVTTKRPRDIDAKRAGALLYGDLGTSKAYVIGLALAIAGYSSFWLILSVSILCIIVGMNYIIVCRCYPNGGGVYASVRKRSEVISLIGAFFIVADYLVTAALSGLAAFHYFQVSNALIWTCIAIGVIGALNFFGPKHTGKLAFYVVVLTLACLIILAIFSLPHLGQAAKMVKPLGKNVWDNWKNFVSVIVALSGVEAIANLTGIMKLDPGFTQKNPKVVLTARKAILSVVIEVAIFTSLFSFASLSLKGLSFQGGDVFAHGQSIRDFLLRYLGEVFFTSAFGKHAGLVFAWVISLAVGVLLLSAVNTALNGLIALQYLLSQDGELHTSFQRINRYGVPYLPLMVATIFPIVILAFVRDIPGLADLYAVGFVGAILTNLFSTSTDPSLQLRVRERIFMFFSALILLCVELTLFIDKPKARIFVLAIVLSGLILRSFAKEWQGKKEQKKTFSKELLPPKLEKDFSILCATRQKSHALEYAIKVAQRRKCPLYILFFKEQKVISEEDANKTWQEDLEASEVFNWVKQTSKQKDLYFYYSITDAPANTIAAYGKALHASALVMEMALSRGIFDLVQVKLIHEVKEFLEKNIQLIVIP